MDRGNKTILITGAGSGIGKAAATALLQRGHTVIATTETEVQAEALREEIKKLTIKKTQEMKEMQEMSKKIEIIKLDITVASDREKVTSYDIDVLINNAGIGETGSLAEIPIERVRRNFEVNVFSTIEMTQVALKGMMKKGKGTVIVVSSLAGRIPSAFLNPYSMTKFALSGGMAALRQEIHRVQKNVHVCLIEPGAYATGFNERMLAKKYEWMDGRSYFSSIIPELKKEDRRRFASIEQKSTASIVRKIVKAAEAEKPRMCYIAPWYQGFGIYLMRVFGK